VVNLTDPEIELISLVQMKRIKGCFTDLRNFCTKKLNCSIIIQKQRLLF